MDFLAGLTCDLGIAGFVWTKETYSNIKRSLQDNILMCGYENSPIIRNFLQFWHKTSRHWDIVLQPPF